MEISTSLSGFKDRDFVAALRRQELPRQQCAGDTGADDEDRRHLRRPRAGSC